MFNNNNIGMVKTRFCFKMLKLTMCDRQVKANKTYF